MGIFGGHSPCLPKKYRSHFINVKYKIKKTIFTKQEKYCLMNDAIIVDYLGKNYPFSCLHHKLISDRKFSHGILHIQGISLVETMMGIGFSRVL